MTPAPRDARDTLGGLGFVLIWSTGYVSAAFALEGVGPFTLAVLRFLGTAVLIGSWLLVRRASIAPSLPAVTHAAIAGVLLQAGFFGFIYAAMREGVEPAVAGLITGLMPLTTALGAALLLSEPLPLRSAAGLGLGLAGVMFVVGPELRVSGHLLGHIFAGLALLSLSLGTLYQKRHASQLDPRLGLLIHASASMLVLLPLAWGFEHLDLHLTAASVGGIAWAILVNSCAGVLLYLWLLGRGAAGRVASVFYLVPPVTAVLAALFLGARFTWADGLGFALAALGVWMSQRA